MGAHNVAACASYDPQIGGVLKEGDRAGVRELAGRECELMGRFIQVIFESSF